MPRLLPAELSRISTRVIQALGASEVDAATVADHLVTANLAGHDSHGVVRLAQYRDHVRDGRILPRARVRTVRDAASTALLDGGGAWGQVVAAHAVDLAMLKASSTGLAAVSVRSCYHIGRVGVYPEAAARRGFIAQLWCNGHGVARVAPWGGTDARLATNPVAIAIPTSSDPIVVDITTSVVAEGKVRVARNAGKPVPEGWVLDAEGRPTTDPSRLYEGGTLLPLGGREGHKGYGLSVVVDALGGLLSGAGCGRMTANVGNGLFLQLTDPGAFGDRAEFIARVDAYVDYLRSSPLRPGVDAIRLPGEPEQRLAAARRTQGIDIDDGTWAQVAEVASSLDVTLQ